MSRVPCWPRCGAGVTAIARYPFHLDLFTVGTDNRVYSCWWDDRSGWHGWFPPGDLVCRPDSAVNVVARHRDQLDLFTTAADGRIMSTWWNVRGGWGTWFQVSGGVASAGSVVKVAHPAMLQAIAAGKKKNDRVDARSIGGVWPPALSLTLSARYASPVRVNKNETHGVKV